MKTFKVLGLSLLFACFFVVNNSNAQPPASDGALIYTMDGATLFWCKAKVWSTEFKLEVTPFGNVNCVAVWYLPPGNKCIPEKVEKRPLVIYDIWGVVFPDYWKMVDEQALFFPDGKVKAVFHLNGSGYITPGKKVK